MISIDKVEKYFWVDKLVIHSLDLCLYQASVVIDEQEHLVVDRNERPLRTHNLIEMQKLCRKIKAKKQVLRHESPYDEMIGLTPSASGNRLEVEIKDNQLY